MTPQQQQYDYDTGELRPPTQTEFVGEPTTERMAEIVAAWQALDEEMLPAIGVAEAAEADAHAAYMSAAEEFAEAQDTLKRLRDQYEHRRVQAKKT